MFILKIISKLCSAWNNTCQSEEASELGHIGLLYCLPNQKYISITLNMTHYFHRQLATYGDLELLAQLVNTRRNNLSINIMNVLTQANWDKWLCFAQNCSSDLPLLCDGNPKTVVLVQKELCLHFIKILETNLIAQFPTLNTQWPVDRISRL